MTPDAESLPAGRITVPEHVARRVVGDEMVLLNLSTGRYHGLNPTGGRMLELLEETGSARQTAERVAAEFGADAEMVRQDLAELCAELAERGLIAIEPS